MSLAHPILLPSPTLFSAIVLSSTLLQSTASSSTCSVSTQLSKTRAIRRISELVPQAVLGDSHTRLIEVDISLRETEGMSQAYEVLHYPLHYDVAIRGRAGLTSFEGEANHELPLVTPKHFQANVNASATSQVEKRVQWHTRCARHISIDAEILAESSRLQVHQEEGEAEQEDEPSPTQRRQRLSALQSQPLLLFSSLRTPSSDPSWTLDNDRRSEPEEDTSDGSKTIARSLRLQARTLA